MADNVSFTKIAIHKTSKHGTVWKSGVTFDKDVSFNVLSRY